MKAQYKNKRTAKHATSGLVGIKHVRLGSAIVFLSNMHNKKQASNAMHSHKGYAVKPSDEDERLLIESL